MKRLTMAAFAAVSLGVFGHGTLWAAGQPDSNAKDTGGAVPGHQFGTSADVQAKKKLDEQKYQSSSPERAAGMSQGSSSSKKE